MQSIAQLACSLEHAGIYCGAGVTKEAMQCALKAHMTGRCDHATAREVFDEFATGPDGLGKPNLAMACATLGNLLDAEGVDNLFEELDEDADGAVSRVEFEVWWETEVAPNQAINRRAAALERFQEEAAEWAAEAGGKLSVAQVFDKLDTDGSGTLDLSEVERLAAALGVVLSQTIALQIFEEMDADGDGRVDLLEFEAWWATHYSEPQYSLSSTGNVYCDV